MLALLSETESDKKDDTQNSVNDSVTEFYRKHFLSRIGSNGSQRRKLVQTTCWYKKLHAMDPYEGSNNDKENGKK